MLGTTTSLVQSVSHIQIDWLIVFAFFLGFAFDGYSSGGARVSAAAVALPLAVFLSGFVHGAFALGATLAGLHGAWVPVVVIAALWAALAFIIGRMIEPSFGAGGIFSALLAGLGGVAVVLALWIGTPALDALFRFGPFLHFAFSASYQLYWVLAGYVALALARG